MKKIEINILLKIKDIFAFLMGIELILMVIISSSPLDFTDIFMILFFPLGISSLVWNKWLYISLMDDKNALYARSGMSYKTFILVGVLLSFITVIAFAIAILRWW